MDWPNYAMSVIDQIANDEVRSQSDLRTLAGLKLNRLVNLAKLLGCPPGTTQVTFVITVSKFDPALNDTVYFTHDIKMRATGNWSAIQGDSAAAVRDEAIRRSITSPQFAVFGAPGSFNAQYNYVRCS